MQQSAVPVTWASQRWLRLAITWRLLQGVAVILVIGRSYTLFSQPEYGQLAPCLPIAAILSGLACGTAVDRFAMTTAGRRTAWLMSCICLIIGLAVTYTTLQPAILLSAVFLTGCSAVGDWSSMTDIVRGSLPAKQRWGGMRWLIASFPVGFLLGVCVAGADVAVVVTVIAASGLMIRILMTPLSSPAAETQPPVAKSESTSMLSVGGSQTAPPVAAESSTDGAGTTSHEDTDCDSTDCCGGNARQFTRMRFSAGVVISALGHFLLWSVIVRLLVNHFDSTFIVVATTVGVLLGCLLTHSAAPSVGYTILLLPFLAGAGGALIAMALIPSESISFAIATFAAGLACGGVVTGTNAVLGEQYYDCSTDPTRTRVLSVSLFVAALLVLAFELCSILMQSVFVAVIMQLLLLVSGFVVLRAIPSPILSSYGTDETDSESEYERQDIIAAIKR